MLPVRHFIILFTIIAFTLAITGCSTTNKQTVTTTHHTAKSNNTTDRNKDIQSDSEKSSTYTKAIIIGAVVVVTVGVLAYAILQGTVASIGSDVAAANAV